MLPLIGGSLSCKSVSEYVGITKEVSKIPYLSNSAWFYLCSEEFLFSIAKVENAQARTHQLKTKESGEINADEMQLRSDPKKIKSES